MTYQTIISLFALIVAIVSLIKSFYEKKIKLSIYLAFSGQIGFLDIYNLSNHKITITSFEIYSSRLRLFTKRNYSRTWYNDGDFRKYPIGPHESIMIEFKENYSLNNFIASLGLKERVYIKLLVNGKKKIIKRIV